VLAKKKVLAEFSKTEVAHTLQGLLAESADITCKEAVLYSYNIMSLIGSASLEAAETITTAEIVKEIAKQLVSFDWTDAVNLVATVSHLTWLATPLFIIGIIGAVHEGLQLLLGSNEGRLLLPVVKILNQKIVIGADKRLKRLSEYYK